MVGRLTRRVVTFSHPFYLDELSKGLPAGSYAVETIVEKLEGPTFLADRHLSTTLVIAPPTSGRGAKRRKSRYLEVDPAGLESALQQDAAKSTSMVLARSREFAELTALAVHSEASGEAATDHWGGQAKGEANR